MVRWAVRSKRADRKDQRRRLTILVDPSDAQFVNLSAVHIDHFEMPAAIGKGFALFRNLTDLRREDMCDVFIGGNDVTMPYKHRQIAVAQALGITVLQAERVGMLPMRTDGMRWVAAGVTSPEEVLRVTRD